MVKRHNNKGNGNKKVHKQRHIRGPLTKGVWKHKMSNDNNKLKGLSIKHKNQTSHIRKATGQSSPKIKVVFLAIQCNACVRTSN